MALIDNRQAPQLRFRFCALASARGEQSMNFIYLVCEHSQRLERDDGRYWKNSLRKVLTQILSKYVDQQISENRNTTLSVDV